MGNAPADRTTDTQPARATQPEAAGTELTGSAWDSVSAVVQATLAGGRGVTRPGVMALQGMAGNTAVTALMGGHAVPLLRQIQRQPQPTPPTPPTPAVPGAALPDFGNTNFVHGGARFDLTYKPVGPLPAIGKVTVKLKIHVKFKDFDRSMMRRKEFVRHRWTAAQLRDFTWPPDEKSTWVARFGTAVSDGWKEKHAFVLNVPDFAPHRATCDVKVEHVDDPAQANNVITAQWVPHGAPRLRSSVTGSESEMDVRDVDAPETHTVRPARLLRQIGGFDHDSAEINSEVASGINEFEAQFRRLAQPGQPFARPDDITVEGAGRASAPGSKRYNKNLGLNRASNVVDRLMNDLSLSSTTARGVGEENATNDAKFRRVDVSAIVGDEREVSQNVAAHEAGHMFGLGDEYVDEKPPEGAVPKFTADQPRHYEDVKETMGEEAANDLLIQGGPSIMAEGSEVKPGHYVYFLRALNSVTSKSWTVE